MIFRARAALCFCLALLGCSAPENPPLELSDGKRVLVPIGDRNVVTVEPIAGAGIADGQTWALLLGQSRALVLRVYRAPEPEGGGDKYVDSLLAALGKSGQADVEGDVRIKLGDLDARLVKAVELRNKPALALWMVIAVAEDGLYTASVYGERDVIVEKTKEVEGFLRSLRIDNRDGSPVRPARKMDGDDVEPPAELTSTNARTPDRPKD